MNNYVTFPASEVAKIVAFVIKYPAYDEILWDQFDKESGNWLTKRHEDDPHLKIVGDHGIYLMASSADKCLALGVDGEAVERDKLQKSGSYSSHYVVYARECDPNDDPDGFYYSKNDIWGGDDGAQDLPVDNILRAKVNQDGVITLCITEKTISTLLAGPGTQESNLKQFMGL